MKKALGVIGILFICWSYTALAAEVQVMGSLDKQQAQVDEEISFTIQILGASGNVPAPRLPAFQGFDSFYTGRTSQFTFVNGRSSATVEFSYVLIPKVAGHFTLSPVEVWIEGKRFQTQSLELEVIGPQIQPQPAATRTPSFARTQAPAPSLGAGPSAPASPSPQPAAQPAFVNDDNIFLKASVDKRGVYPNEQILLTYSLHTRFDTRYEGFEEEPSVSGFWIEDFPLERDLGRETVTVNGKRYMKADIRKIALFPTSVAEYTIQPGVIKVSIREQPKNSSLFDEFFDDSFFSGASFFSRRVERLLKPEPITITVKPFPEAGKPASFKGAVGQFRLSASMDKNEVKQNEPVTLKLVLEGEGNIETLPKPPVPELTAFKIYEGDSSTELFKTGANIGGRKTFEMIFIPTESGNLAIPSLEFSFFDPRRETYQILRTQDFPLRVIPSNERLRLPPELAEKEAFKKAVRVEAKDIRYIHEEFSAAGPAAFFSLVFQALLLVNLGGALSVGYGVFRKRREALFSRDIALKRRTFARARAERRLKALKQVAASKKTEGTERFIGEAEKVLTEYLSNKFNVSSYQFTRQWMEEKLAQIWGAEDPLLEEIRRFYDRTGETRYGRGALDAKERNQVMELIGTVIRRIEKLR